MATVFRLSAATLAFALVATSQACAAQPLKDAFRPVAPATPDPAAADCAAAPTPPARLSPQLFFDNIKGLGFNAQKYEAYRAEVKPLDDFKKGVAVHANAYVAARAPAQAACTLGWLDAWAKADALNQDGYEQTAQNERVWLLAAAASAYLQVRDKATPEQSRAITAWMVRLTTRISAQFGPGKPFPWANNIAAWTGYAKAATGVAANDPALFADGLADARRVLAGAKDGVLPREMERRERALYYHAYALAPLTFTAELAEANGQLFYAQAGAPLPAIAATVAGGYHDPVAFAARAGGAQQNLDKCGVNAWTVVWSRRTPTPDVVETSKRCGGKSFIPELGGDIHLLYGAS